MKTRDFDCVVEKLSEQLVEIDPDKLDQEWLNHPKKFLHWAERLADARKEYVRLKARLEVVDAELDRDIRQSPENFKLEKITEASVTNTIILQSAHHIALKRLNQTKHEMDVLQVAVDALSDRKKALENLVVLWSQSYFASPKAPTQKSKELIDGIKKKNLRGKMRTGA